MPRWGARRRAKSGKWRYVFRCDGPKPRLCIEDIKSAVAKIRTRDEGLRRINELARWFQQNKLRVSWGPHPIYNEWVFDPHARVRVTEEWEQRDLERKCLVVFHAIAARSARNLLPTLPKMPEEMWRLILTFYAK